MWLVSLAHLVVIVDSTSIGILIWTSHRHVAGHCRTSMRIGCVCGLTMVTKLAQLLFFEQNDGILYQSSCEETKMKENMTMRIDYIFGVVLRAKLYAYILILRKY